MNRKTNARKEDASADSMEIQNLLNIISSLTQQIERSDNRTKERVFDFLNQAEIGFVLKDRLYQLITAGKKLPVLLSELQSMELDKDLYGALMEILTA